MYSSIVKGIGGICAASMMALGSQVPWSATKSMQVKLKGVGAMRQAEQDSERAAIDAASMSLKKARSLLRQGRLEEAETAAAEAIRLGERVSMLIPQEGRRVWGRIRMKQDRYSEALEWLLGDYVKGQQDERLDLDIALCHVRLGDLEKARRSYSDRFITRFSSFAVEELPGTRDLKQLEASILFALGVQWSVTASGDREALEYFRAAAKLAPNNPAIAYLLGSMLFHMGRLDEAKPYLQVARGRVVGYRGTPGEGGFARNIEDMLARYPK